jgi:2-keto-3-deoxy-L-fuconate dehydrogenase
MGSASALRGMKRTALSYSAARGAQLAYMQAVALELAPHNIQVNAIAQNFVDNPTYFPPEVQANPRFQDGWRARCRWAGWCRRDEDAPVRRLPVQPGGDCFVGQVFPVCGGWVRQ